MMFDVGQVTHNEHIGSESSHDPLRSLSRLQFLLQLTHRQLVEGVIEHYQSQTRSLFRAHGCTPAEVDDLFQEVCIRLTQSKNIGNIENLNAYVRVVAMNVLRDKFRVTTGTNTVADFSLIHELPETEQSNPEAFLQSSRALADIWKRIDRLPPRCKEAFLLSRVEGKPYRAIADEMGITVSMVEKYIGRGLKVMRGL